MGQNGVQAYQKVSSSVADALVKLHRAGGLSLVFLFLGIGLVVLANFGGAYQLATLSLGVFLLVASFGIFAFLHLRGPVRAIQTLRENRETIDSLQELGLELTAIANSAQAFALRYSTEIAEVLDRSLPLLHRIPGVGSKVKELQLDRASQLAKSVLDATASAESIIRDTESALRTADFSLLRKYSASLKEARAGLRTAIAGTTESSSAGGKIDPLAK